MYPQDSGPIFAFLSEVVVELSRDEKPRRPKTRFRECWSMVARNYAACGEQYTPLTGQPVDALLTGDNHASEIRCGSSSIALQAGHQTRQSEFGIWSSSVLLILTNSQIGVYLYPNLWSRRRERSGD